MLERHLVGAMTRDRRMSCWAPVTSARISDAARRRRGASIASTTEVARKGPPVAAHVAGVDLARGAESDGQQVVQLDQQLVSARLHTARWNARS